MTRQQAVAAAPARIADTVTGPPPAGTATIGVDIGGTKTRAGLVLPGGRAELIATVPTPATAGPAAVIAAVLGLVHQVRQEADTAGLPAPGAIGIGSAGVISPRSGSVLAATGHIAGWAGTPLAARVAQASGLPTRALNDVHAHALGEARYGAGQDLPVVLVVAAGTGVGGALVIDGIPQTGADGVAGHLGHVPAEEAHGLSCSCGRTGHLESVASGPGLLARYRQRGGYAADAREVVDAAGHGEPLAGECLALAGRALGRAAGGWINMVNPDAVVVTGGLAQAGKLWWSALRQGACEQCVDLVRSCPIRAAQTGPHAAILGAAEFAGMTRHPANAEGGHRDG
jgi:glucokinase